MTATTPRSPTTSAHCTIDGHGDTPPAGVHGIIVGTNVPAYAPAANASGSGARARIRVEHAIPDTIQRRPSNAASRTSASTPTAHGSGVNRAITTGTKRNATRLAPTPKARPRPA